MANVKISALPAATTPLAGTETVPIVQSATTKQVAVSALLGASGLSGDAFSTGTPVDLSNSTALHPFADWAAYASRQGTLASAGITTPDGIVFDAADSGFYLSILTLHIALTLTNPPDLRLLKADDGFWMSEHRWIGVGGVTQNVRFVAEGWVDAGAGVFTPAASLGDVTDVSEGTISQAWFTVLKLG